MKRLWLGAGLAAILLALGIWTSISISTMENAIAGTLETAAEEALSGNFQTATTLVKSAHSQWEDSWHRIAVIADHAPMDEIDSLFAQVLIYAETGSPGEFAAHCQRISKLIIAVGEAHAFNWWNLL